MQSPTTLQTKTKFDIRNPRKDLSIMEDNFFKWTNGNHYRTSTNDMTYKVSMPAPLWRNFYYDLMLTVTIVISREKEPRDTRVSGLYSREQEPDPSWATLH